MNYCYDILININEDSVYKFYEWDKCDPIEFIKKIPLYRVSNKVINDFLLNRVKVSIELLNEIQDKTILKNNKISQTIQYSCVLCDCKNCLVVEFNSLGEVVGRSNLLLEDEINILEFIYSYNESKVSYEKLEIYNISNSLRQEDLVKKVIKLEVETLLKNNNSMKLKYLFNELFEYEEDNTEIISSCIKKELKKHLSNKTKKVYDLILLSYSNS